MERLYLTAVLAGFFLDMCFGDPYWLPHPVRGIGRLTAALENALRGRGRSAAGEQALGALTAVLVLLVTGGTACLVLWGARLLHPWAGLAAESLLCYQLLAAKSLRTESMKVYEALNSGQVEEARGAVSMIVGRDTRDLTDIGIAKAAVETVAENTSDGVIAPLFYMALFGGLGGILYKAVNTMDSMVGYRNEKYKNFGRAAAKLDDVCSFIPARLAAVLMIASAFLLGFDGKYAARIYRRDRRCHASPNSAQTESVCAGALDIELAGDAWYFGVLHRKPTIGDPLRAVEYRDIERANRLMYGTAFAGAAFVLAAWLLL